MKSGLAMSQWKISPSSLSGTLKIPSSKSHSIRALLFALLARGKTVIHHLLHSPDVMAMITACRHLGAQIEFDDDRLEMIGIDGKIEGAEDVIQCGNSGLILRFVGAIAALSSKPIVITGDRSIRHNRPLIPLLDGLSQLGVEAYSLRGDGGAPIYIRGPLQSGGVKIDGADSQPVSGMLIASAFAPGPVEIFVTNPGEMPWVRLTLKWLDRLGISYQTLSPTSWRMEGKSSFQGFEYRVPGDFSSCAYPLAAALLTDSEVTLENLDFTDSQGDKKVIEILQEMGAHVEIEKTRVHVKKGSLLKGISIDVNVCIDAIPILAVIGCFAKGKTEIREGAIARTKESDRISSIVRELKKMGADIEEKPDGLVVAQSSLKGASLHSFFDHRIAMSLVVAGLAAQGETSIAEIECVDKSYPNFKAQIEQLGAKMC